MRNLRVALCQLESHPAIYGGHVALAEEPFVPYGDRWSLSRLGNKGIRGLTEVTLSAALSPTARPSRHGRGPRLPSPGPLHRAAGSGSRTSASVRITPMPLRANPI